LAVRDCGETPAMSMFSKRNALVGAAALFFAKKYAKTKVRGMTGRVRLGR